ncbi:hypothetical protein ATANTOWER_006735, partial [Ataeniobius toweri]|nr:hypothetical protein [Ataeniobius toweri]
IVIMQQSAGRVIPLPATALMTPIRPLNFLLEMGKHCRSPLSQELTPYWSWSTLRVEGDRGSVDWRPVQGVLHLSPVDQRHQLPCDPVWK